MMRPADGKGGEVSTMVTRGRIRWPRAFGLSRAGPVETWTIGTLVAHGVIGGIIAGIAFALGQMLISQALGESLWRPLRLIGSIVLGKDALSPGYSLATAAAAGIGVNLILTALYGLAFTLGLAVLRLLNAGPFWMIVLGAIWGLALWAINFLSIGPVLFDQFRDVDQFWNGFVAHTVFFGGALGAYFAIVARGANVQVE